MLTRDVEIQNMLFLRMQRPKRNDLVLNRTGSNLGWKAINWAFVQKRVFKYQRSIYLASKSNDIPKVRKLQNLLFKSLSARLLSVRRVTQDNKGKSTSGVNGIKNVSPQNRVALATSLVFPMKSKPLRRVWIPKPGKVEKRPLGIPTIHDRCLQALMKLGLEPEWEARFESSSFGFRPGKSCHDAIANIKGLIQKKAKYVIDANIAKCFEKIDHKALLDKIGLKGKLRIQIEYWLKSGGINFDTFTPTTEGTPQGGVISPLLANIAFHGMENHLKNFVKRFPMVWASGEKIHLGRRPDTVSLIRYADAFVILHHEKKVALACLEEIKIWLASTGLEISQTKTRVTHTLRLTEEDSVEQGFDGKVGFDFLGFTFKQFQSRFCTPYSTNKTPLGFLTLVLPSKVTIRKYHEKLHDLILKKGKVLSQNDLINALNPVIRGWANYYGCSDANTAHILSKMDYFLYLKVRRWAKRVHGTTGKARVCFKQIGSYKWVFATESHTLLRHVEYSRPINAYVKVQSKRSPFDNNQIYWNNRFKQNVNGVFNARQSALLIKQNGRCKYCRQFFDENDVLEVDHISPRSSGGSDSSSNLQLLHRHCHDRKTQEEK